MSGRFDFKGDGGKQKDKSSRKLYSKVQKQPLLHNVASSSSLIYDNSEFPSLSESSIKTSNVPGSEVKFSKYSDKLKLCSQSQISSTKSVSICHSKNDSSSSNFKKSSNETTAIDSKISSINSVQSKSSQPPKHLIKQPSYAKQAAVPVDGKNQPTRQNNSANASLPPKLSHSASRHTSANSMNSNVVSSKSGTERQSSKEIKCRLMFDKCRMKNEEEISDGTTKKKKKRKSKIKRQTALQTGKITVLTPEFHSKILNQSSAFNSQSSKSVLTDINDEEEYPELGKSFVPTSQKENVIKKENNAMGPSKEEQVYDDLTKEKTVAEKGPHCDNTTVEKKGKGENKTVHLNDPITVTFFDILTTRNSKVKEKDLKDDVNPSSSFGLLKVKLKKGTSHAPNLLDSSKPAVKRGKERENPRPKKPSHLKKIILLDRKLRREHVLQMSSNTDPEENDCITSNEFQENEDMQKIVTSDSEIEEENVLSESICNECKSELPEDISLDEFASNLFPISCDAELKTVESSIEEEFMNLSVCEGQESNEQDQSVSSEVPKEPQQTEKYLNVLESNDSLLKSLSSVAKAIDVTEREKAAKILLHTRNFREYCNHLVSKDIDTAVHALLDDLARFQDRLHQKDPVKARMKRRMIYGVKEVKKHMKLKKLKCIVIATDIENVETEGGLNDILNDIKSLAADHNIPCVFALSRKALGKVCHKPVPVSCIGVFNSEGSEANFKKMVELLSQSKKDYVEIMNKLTKTLSEEEAATLFKAKKEAPETLHEIRTNMLREIFLPSKSDGSVVGDTTSETKRELNSADGDSQLN